MTALLITERDRPRTGVDLPLHSAVDLDNEASMTALAGFQRRPAYKPTT
jgi:hypothetical protein